MSAAAELLAQLADRGVEVTPEDGRLRCRGPRGALTPELRDRLAALKSEVLDELAAEIHTVRLIRTRVLWRGEAGVCVVEIQPLDPPGPPRFERRIVSGAVGLITDASDDPDLASLWIRAGEPPTEAPE